MKPRLAITLAVTAVGLLAAGCSSSPAAPSNQGSGSTIPLLRVGESFTVPSLDPTKPGDSVAITQLGLETLVSLGPQGQLEPNLATSWSQAGPVTWVYHLRQGVRFWDGHPLTAADVAYSLNYQRAPGSGAAYIFPTVKDVTASGPYTVVVTLTHPDASWQYDPTEAGIFEQRFAETHKATLGRPGVLIEGTGPWEFDSLDPTKGAQLSANPHWWGGRVPIQRISFTFYSSETSEALAFRAGEVDLDPNILNPQSFAATSGATLLNAPSCQGGGFYMNTLNAPWNDVHVRRAVAYALNRSAVIAANGGYASPNYTLIPVQMLRTIASPSQVDSLLSSIPLYPYDVAKARQEIAESRYPHGFSTTLVEYTGLGQAINQSEVIAADLQKIGIKAQIKQDSLAAWEALATGPDSTRPTSFSYSGCNSPDPSWYMFLLGSWNLKPGQWNLTGYAPAGLDTLIKAGVATTNPAQRFATYSRILQNLAVNVPSVALYTQDQSVALSGKFAWPGYNPYSLSGTYALAIKPAS